MRPLRLFGIALLVAVTLGILSACTQEPVGKVSIASLAGGASVVSPFKVQMVAEGVTVEPASAGVHDRRGHHHIIVDDNLSPKGQPIPSDVNHLHFGKGQTEAILDLSPGEHTLRLLFAKGDHIPYDPIITSSIKVTVTEQRGVAFSEPKNGAQAISPFIVKMAAQSLVVEPATAGVREGRGHHHIIVDADLPPSGQPIPSDAQHLHFGKGQTEAVLDLAPGKHTLRLVFADANHIPFDPAIASAMEVNIAEQRKVSFLELVNGAQVTSPLTLKMGATGLVVEPATAGVREGGGHHHIIVDADLPAVGLPIPSDAQHVHFGKAQTEATLELAPGEHTLQLVFADANHVPYYPYVTTTVKVKVVS